jgi:hypothetical protein
LGHDGGSEEEYSGFVGDGDRILAPPREQLWLWPISAQITDTKENVFVVSFSQVLVILNLSSLVNT